MVGIDIGTMVKERRVMMNLTLRDLATSSGVSCSHLGRIERGERFPSATILHKIAKPLGFEEAELMVAAQYLSPRVSPSGGETDIKKVDPYVAMVLAQEPVKVQRAIVGLLSIIKLLAKGG